MHTSIRWAQDGVSLMMIEALPETRMMLAEISISKLARNCPVLLSKAFLSRFLFFTFLLFLLHCSALVQFFQLFSEFQPNEFYATGEVSRKAPLFSSYHSAKSTLNALGNHMSSCTACIANFLKLSLFLLRFSRMQESMFQRLATTSTRIILLPK